MDEPKGKRCTGRKEVGNTEGRESEKNKRQKQRETAFRDEGPP